MDPDKVRDDSTSKGYKNMWNRGKYQHKADLDAYAEFMKEEEREQSIM